MVAHSVSSSLCASIALCKRQQPVQLLMELQAGLCGCGGQHVQGISRDTALSVYYQASDNLLNGSIHSTLEIHRTVISISMENLPFQLLFIYDTPLSGTGSMCCFWVINNPFRTGCGLSSRKFMLVNASERMSVLLLCVPFLLSFCAACQLRLGSELLKYGY